MAGITANELIDPSVLKTLEKLNKELKNTLGILGDLTKQQKATNEELKKGAKTNEDLAANKAKVNKATQTLTEQEKNLIKIQQQEQKVIEQVAGSYNQMNAKLNAARLSYKNMSDVERNSKFGKETLKNIQQLDTKLKAFDKSLGQAGRQVGFYERAWSKAQSAFMMFTGALAAGGGIIKTFNYSLTVSESLSDKWAVTMAGMKARLDFFLKALISGKGGFDNFWQGMRDAANAAKEYAAVLDQLEDRQIAMQFQEARSRVEYAKNMIIVRDVTKSETERIAAARNVIKMEQDLADERKQIADEKYKKLLETTAIENRVTEDQLIKFVDTDKKYVDSLQENATRYEIVLNEKLKKVNDYYRNTAKASSSTFLALNNDIKNAEKEVSTADPIGKAASDTLKKLSDVSKDSKTAVLDAYKELQAASEDFYVKTARPQMRLSQLLAEGKKEEVKEKIDLDKIYLEQRKSLADNERKILAQSQQDSLNDYEKNIQRRINLATEEFINGKRSAEALSDEMLTIQIEELDAKLEYAKANGIETLDIETKLIAAKKALKDAELDDYKEKEKEKFAFDEEMFNKKVELANTAFELFNVLGDRELDDIETRKNKELADAGENAQAKKEIEAKYQSEIARIKRKQAIADKAQGLFNIGINTAQGITKALATANIPLSILIGVLGAAQAATVLAKPIPKFAKGVKNLPEATLAEVGEIGRELIKTKEGQMILTPDRATKMVLPKGASVLTNSETEKYIQTNGIDNAKMDVLINEQKKTRQMLANKKQSNLNITQKGWEYSIERGNSRIKYIDKYFRN